MKQSHPIYKLWLLILAERKEIISIYFYAVLSGLVQLSIPLGVQTIIGFVIGGTMVSSIYMLIFFIVLGVLASGIMQINQMKIIERIQQKIFTYYSFRFANKISTLDTQKLSDIFLPEKTTRFFDTLNIQKGFSKILLDIPLASIQILFGLILLAFYHQVFIFFGLFLIFIVWIILKYTSKKGLETSLKESKYKYAVAGWLVEMGRLVHEFKYANAHQYNIEKTDENVTNYLRARISHFKILLIQYASIVGFKVVITLLLLSIGSTLLINQQINIGEFIAAEIVILMIIAAVEKLITSLENIYDIITGLEKLDTIIRCESEVSGSIVERMTAFDIKIKDLNFSYGSKSVFNQFDLNIQNNQKVCLSSEINAGASTLLKIVSLQYPSVDADFSINGIPFKNYNLATIRSQIAFYQPNDSLFYGSLLDNIRIGNKSITPDQILNAAEKWGAKSYFSEFEFGFDTMIEPEGHNVSKATAQIILLMRVIASDSLLWVFDSPGVFLGAELREKLFNYLVSVDNRTIIVSSNDEFFKEQFDQVIQL